jgi:hypothetical protein
MPGRCAQSGLDCTGHGLNVRIPTMAARESIGDIDGRTGPPRRIGAQRKRRSRWLFAGSSRQRKQSPTLRDAFSAHAF